MNRYASLSEIFSIPLFHFWSHTFNTQLNLQNWIPALNALDSILAAIIADVKPQICLPDPDPPSSDDGERPKKLSAKDLKQNVSILANITQFLSKLLKISVNKEIFSSIEVNGLILLIYFDSFQYCLINHPFYFFFLFCSIYKCSYSHWTSHWQF